MPPGSEGAGMAGGRLTMAERQHIALLAGSYRMGVREIAARTGRSASTISRELRRGVSGSPRAYRPLEAHQKAAVRAWRSRPCKLAPGTALRGEVAALLRQGWSPGQIAGRLRRDHPGARVNCHA